MKIVLAEIFILSSGGFDRLLGLRKANKGTDNNGLDMVGGNLLVDPVVTVGRFVIGDEPGGGVLVVRERLKVTLVKVA